MKNNKIMSTLVVLTLLLSGMVMLYTTTDFTFVDSVGATTTSLIKDGTELQEKNLTCGELVTIEVNDNGLNAAEEYTAKVWKNGTGWIELEDGDADDYGNIEIEFNVPSYDDLGVNPVKNNSELNVSAGHLSPGQWNIRLFDESGTEVGSNHTINIGNMFDVRFYDSNDDEIDYVVYNTTYEPFYIRIYNWTSSGWDLQDDDTFNVEIFDPDSTSLDDKTVTTGVWDWDFMRSDNNYNSGSDNLENYYWVNASINSNWYSNVSLPVKVNMTATVSSDLEWGDEVSISGYVRDGQDDGVPSYDLRVYAPVDGGYDVVESTFDTYSSGRYSFSVQTGSDETGNAGTWYVGTYNADDASPRLNMTYEPPYIPGFIPYHSFEVGTKDDARVNLEMDDDIIAGFNQTINVSVYNSSWMDVYEYQEMSIHVTGVPNYNWTTGETYDEDDIIQIDPSAISWSVDEDEKYCYYEFDHYFDETGTVTVWVSHNGYGNDTQNLTSIASSDDANPVSGFYTKKYSNEGMLPNITGTDTFDVVGAGDMNLIVEDMVESVLVDDTGDYQNDSSEVTLRIYGETELDGVNATVEITGCGLDITIKEDDPGNTPECTGYPGNGNSDGVYTVDIGPKTAGTITITVTNETEDESISKDYSVTGLTGSVTTSDGDDLLMTVGTTETITATVTNGAYSTVRVNFFDDGWTHITELNETSGDGTTEGEGLNGIFTFVPDEDDLDEIGYIVVTAEAAGNYMYDIIEVEPIYDLEIELLQPTLANATPIITVGLEQDFEFRLVDSDGNVVDEHDPSVTIKLIDEDHDEDNPLMTWSSEAATIDSSGDEWEVDDLRPYWKGQLVITGTNASDGIAHEGNLTLDVEYATITYSPDAVTAGIGTENLTVTVTGVDANGDPLPDGTRMYFYCNDSVNTDVGGDADNEDNVDFDDFYVEFDEDGVGEFDLAAVGDMKTSINGTLQISPYSPPYNPSNGNRTLGEFNIYYPNFAINPDTIYLGQSNEVEITATDTDGEPIYGINLTFVSSIPGILSSQPDPVMTNADGIAELSVSPQAGGKLNVTIARNVEYEDGQLNWTNSVITDSYVTVTSIKTMKISISKSPIYQGETLTVTVTSGNDALSGVDVEFAETTAQTDSNGEATFTVPDPGVESATYTIIAEKSGYTSADKSITVIKVYSVQIVGPNTAPAPGEEFTVSIIANGQALAGATVEFNGDTYTSNARGELTLTAPDSAGSHTISASYENYEDGTLTINIEEGEEPGVPGFELLTLVAALGAAFILFKRRKRTV
jgi:hypothetical protein